MIIFFDINQGEDVELYEYLTIYLYLKITHRIYSPMF